jgi:lysophospholipase L1-like esterase
MKIPKRSALLVSLLIVVTSAGLAQDAFALRDGDRVVFYGDSITEQRLYTTYAEAYVVTRFPKANIVFVHSGWGGDRVSGGGGGTIDVRLWRDVLSYNPTVVTIMLGMNDGQYRAFDQQIFDAYATGYKHIVDVLKRQVPGVRITAIQPSAYDDVTRPPADYGGYNATLLRYAQFVKELAAGEKLGLADLNTPVVAALTKAKAIDAQQSQRLMNDRVHPGAGIHLVMAAALLKSWNAPAIVTDVEIDASRGEPVRQQNTRVTELRKSAGLSWTQADDALPMYLGPTPGTRDPVFALALESSDVVEALNRQPLKVTGLGSGSYTLKIDGEAVGTFTSEQLQAGVNLSAQPTPMMRQAEAVWALTIKHDNMHSTRWRQVQVAMENDASVYTLRALEALDELEAELVRQQRAMAQPLTRRYEVVPN